MAGLAGMAGQFLSSCESKYFRDRIVAQLAGAKESHFPDPNSGDQMEKFIAQNSPEQLEEFIFKNSKGNREEYLSLTAEMLLAVRQCKGSPGQGRERMGAADSPEASSEPQQQTSTNASTDEEAAKAD